MKLNGTRLSLPIISANAMLAVTQDSATAVRGRFQRCIKHDCSKDIPGLGCDLSIPRVT